MVCRVDARPRVDMETLVNVVKDLGWRWPEEAGIRESVADVAAPAEVPESDKAWVRAYSAGNLVAKVEIKDLPFTIGRGPGNSLVIPQKEISRRHVMIDRVAGRFIVEDLHSANGLLVNARNCDTAVLKSGDVISVGLVNVVFSIGEESHENTVDDIRDTARNLKMAAETQALPEDCSVIEIAGRLQAK